MTESRLDAIIGAVVLAAAVAFVIHAARVTGLGPAGGSYEVAASFVSVEGVRVGTDVRLGGVKVGTVSGIVLNPETFRADVRLAIRDGLALPEDSAAVVASEGLLGGSFIELLPGGSPFDIAPGGVIEDTQGAISLITLLVRAVAGGGAGEEAAP